MRSHALNLSRPTKAPRNSSGVIAAKTNWKYASVAVGKWNGMSVFAPETAWPCSEPAVASGVEVTDEAAPERARRAEV